MKSKHLILRIQEAQQELIMSILNIQKKYELPAFLIDLMVSASLSDVKSCVNKELINTLANEKKEDGD